jgi:predicted transcriptional regulator
MTQTELVQMLISKCNGQAESIKCLKIELEEAQAVARVHKSDMRVTIDALSAARGGYSVRKQNQGTVENLRLAIEGLLTSPQDQQEQAVTFATKIMSLTETEVSF